MIDEKLQAQLRAKYNPDGSHLRLHQLKMLEMLKYFDNLCRKHEIHYWLSSGNCLGLVRHGGFIPWDDDIDVEMLRDDFLKLEKVFKETDNYVLQTWKNEKYYLTPFAKLRDKKSFIKENIADRNYKYKGVFIDILQIESSPRLVNKACEYIRWKCIWPLYSPTNKFKLKIYYLLKQIYFRSIPIIRFTCSWWPNNKLRHTYGVGWCDNTRELKDIFPLQRMKFDGVDVYVPHNLDSYLENIYGDYMRLPSENEIPIPHSSEIIFF